MRQKSGPDKAPAEDAIKDIPRDATALLRRRQNPHRAGGFARGRQHLRAVPPRRHRLVDGLRWSKEFLEAGKRRLAGDTARAATSDEVRDLRRETQALKEVVADLTLENRLLKKRMARPVCEGVDRERRTTANRSLPNCRWEGRAIQAEASVKAASAVVSVLAL
jgi:transposase